MVINKYSDEEKKALNTLLTEFFQMNHNCDNRAYALDTYIGCPFAAKIYHEKFAHIWPSDTFADKLSTVMAHEGIVPIRGPQVQDDWEYKSIEDVFDKNYYETERMKQLVLDTIELLDYNRNCKPIVIVLEDMATVLTDLLHQCDIWFTKAEAYHQASREYEFDIDFEKFTLI